jgi:hypothetical protein
MLQQRLTRNLYTGQTEPLTAPLSFDFTEDLGDKRSLSLLSQYGGAAAAYSLRALGSYNEHVVRVRRASDNDEKDFTASQVSSGEMVNWVNSQTVPPLDIGVETEDGRIPVPEGGKTIGSPAAAYSLRNLSTTYTGNVVDVRRSSDDAVESFTAEEVSDGTLEAWVSEPVTVYTQTVDLNIPTGSGSLYTLPSYSVSNEIGKRYRVTFELKRNSGGAGTTGDDPRLRTSSTWVYSNYTHSSNLTPASNRFEVNQATEEYQTYTVTFTTDAGSSTSPLRFQTYDSDDSYTVRNFTIDIIGQDGTVSKWYDQSGNDNHAVQTTPANQPTIVEGGSLVTNDGNAVVDFSSIDGRHFIFGAGIDLTARTVFYAGRPSAINFQNLLGNISNSSVNFIRMSNNAGGRVWLTDPSASIFVDGSAYAGGDVSDQGYSLNTFVFDSDATVDFLGGTGVPISDTPIVDASEIIIYDSDQSDNRTAIEANIWEYYGITGIPAYDNTVDGFVETWYDQSGNGNDATQSVAGSQPKIVDGGSLVTGDTGEPAFVGDGADDILSFSSSIDFGTGEFFVSTVADFDTGGALVGSAIPNWLLLLTTSSIQVRSSNTNTIYIITPDSPLTAGESYLISLSRVGDDITAYVNGVAQADVETVVSTDTFSTDRLLQRGPNGNPYSDPVSEIIIYDSDQSDNRTAIEGNINAHYNIYA